MRGLLTAVRRLTAKRRRPVMKALSGVLVTAMLVSLLSPVATSAENVWNEADYSYTLSNVSEGGRILVK